MDKLKEIKDRFQEATLNNSLHQDLKEDMMWLIKEAEKLQVIKNEAEDLYNGEIDYSDFGERVDSIL